MADALSASRHGHFARRMDRFAELLSLDDLKRFVAVADCGGFREASRQLNLAQPSLSRSIQALERRIGAALFERTGRGASLTPVGAVLMRHAQIIYADLRSAAGELASLGATASGELIIGANASVTPMLLPRAIVAVTAAMPEARLYAVETRPEHLLSGVEEAQFEIALAPEPLGPVGDAIAVDPVASFPYVVMARSDHPLLACPAPTFADVLAHPWILPEPGTVSARRLDRLFAARGLAEPEGVYRTSSAALGTKLALATGHLVARPYIAVGDMLGSGDFRILPVTDFALHHELVVIRRKLAELKPVTRQLLQQVRAVAAEVLAEVEGAAWRRAPAG